MKEIQPKRKNIRLKNYDYSRERIYFITICIKDRLEILGEIIANKMKLTKEGKVIEENLKIIEHIYLNVKIDEYIIMPNHIHLLLVIQKRGQTTVSKIIKQYKESITKKLGYRIWQKLFYEHIVRNEEEYFKIKEYIQNNVINWKNDCYF